MTFLALRAAGVTGSQQIRLSVSYGKSLVCCGCCFDFLVMCIFIHVCKNKHSLPYCHTDPLQSLVNNVKPMLHSSPGMTHFLQLWSSESIYKGYSGNGLIQKYFLHHHQWLIFPGSPFPLLFQWFGCSIFSQFTEAHVEN